MFTRDGTDLRCHVTVPMTAAALGTTIQLPLLEADVAEADSDMELWVDLEIRPAPSPAPRQTLRGRGVPHLRSQVRGDIVVTIDVETPGRLDDRQQELLRELADAAPRGVARRPGSRRRTSRCSGGCKDAFNPR